jgi:DNA topoisomerase-1
LVRRCQELPGQELFGYLDERGRPRDVTSEDVNRYLREIAGEEFSAKDFRTWSGTVLAATALRELEPCRSQRHGKSQIKRAVEAVSSILGNTPAVCRKCYIHPEILECYATGVTIPASRPGHRINRTGLRPEEKAVMKLLRQKLAPVGKKAASKGRS